MPMFKVRMICEVEIRVDDPVLEQVETESWQKQFYRLKTDQEVAEHLAYNIVANHVTKLSELDGFANLPDACVQATVSYEVDR